MITFNKNLPLLFFHLLRFKSQIQLKLLYFNNELFISRVSSPNNVPKCASISVILYKIPSCGIVFGKKCIRTCVKILWLQYVVTIPFGCLQTRGSDHNRSYSISMASRSHILKMLQQSRKETEITSPGLWEVKSHKKVLLWSF